MHDETHYHDLVASWLASSFVQVEHEVRLDLPDAAQGSYVVADFVAYTPFEAYVVEVEDSADTLEQGLGQALRFAALLDAAPVVVLPADEWAGRSRFGPVEVVTV